jgi:predicted nucleotidyltransferase
MTILPQPANPKKLIDGDLTAQLRQYFGQALKQSSAVIAVYLFGSHGRGRARERSDIDLAFLLDEREYRLEPLEASVPAYLSAARIGMELNKKTDVIILNGSSVEMAYEVVTSGLCLYESDRDRRLEYEATIRGLYFDFRPFLEELRKRCLDGL